MAQVSHTFLQGRGFTCQRLSWYAKEKSHLPFIEPVVIHGADVDKNFSRRGKLSYTNEWMSWWGASAGGAARIHLDKMKVDDTVFIAWRSADCERIFRHEAVPIDGVMDWRSTVRASLSSGIQLHLQTASSGNRKRKKSGIGPQNAHDAFSPNSITPTSPKVSGKSA